MIPKSEMQSDQKRNENDITFKKSKDSRSERGQVSGDQQRSIVQLEESKVSAQDDENIHQDSYDNKFA